MNIAILGFGVVGSGVYELSHKNAKLLQNKISDKLKVKRILDIRNFEKHPARELFTKDFNEILNDSSISIIIECIGGINPAYDYTKAALLKGKSVVTSNKELVATHGKELLKIAREKDTHFLFEASVGGGVPIIRPLQQCLASNNIVEIVGILNGTTNFILGEMLNKEISFANALAEAQKLGYAERNPSADIDGHDACRKASILAAVAFGEYIACDKIATKGIRNITLKKLKTARAQGYAIKLIVKIKRIGGELKCQVKPMRIPLSHPLANIKGVNNAIIVRGDFVGDILLSGLGAGARPTASAIMGDVIEIARDLLKRRNNEILQYA